MYKIYIHIYKELLFTCIKYKYTSIKNKYIQIKYIYTYLQCKMGGRGLKEFD